MQEKDSLYRFYNSNKINLKKINSNMKIMNYLWQFEVLQLLRAVYC